MSVVPQISREALLAQLRDAVGAAHVLTDDQATRRFRKGHRTGEGPVLAVVRPGTLLEQWKVLQAAVAAGRIVIMQAANTGLTGGSTPDGANYDREIVLVNTLRITGVQVIAGGDQVVCLPGATLDKLEQTLAPLGREPHSVIGSSCIGASVLGGICNNSGGALVRRGPAYTELALLAAEVCYRLKNTPAYGQCLVCDSPAVLFLPTGVNIADFCAAADKDRGVDESA